MVASKIKKDIGIFDLVLFLSLVSTPIVGIFKGFESQQRDYKNFDRNTKINTRLSLERARTCWPATMGEGTEIQPTLIGSSYEGSEDMEGQYLCAMDGSTGRIMHQTLIQVTTVASDKDLEKYQSILAQRKLIEDSTDDSQE